MALVVGILAVLRLTGGAPGKKIDPALWYAGAADFARSPVKGRASCRQVPQTAVSTVEYSAVLKRLGDLEEKVSVLSKKPAELPPEKEELLMAAVSRVEALEAELEATRKVKNLPPRKTLPYLIISLISLDASVRFARSGPARCSREAAGATRIHR